MDVASNRYRKRYQLQGDFTPWESLGSGVELLEVYLSDDRGRENQVEVPFDRMGVSPTYGVHLRCPDGRELRLLLAGVSGQLTQIESAGQMKDAFESIAAH